MKKIYTLLFALLTLSSYTQTIWDGPTITIEKEAFVDITLPENQDFLTENVILVRGDSQGLFNIVTQASYSGPGPEGTEWAVGTTSDGIENLTFDSWTGIQANGPISILGQNLVLHLILDDIYLDFKQVTWGTGQGQGVPGGGQHSYERSTPNPLSANNILAKVIDFQLYPNPAINTLNIRLSEKSSNGVSLEILNSLGQTVHSRVFSPTNADFTQQIDISELENGIYFVRLTKGRDVTVQKFLLSE